MSNKQRARWYAMRQHFGGLGQYDGAAGEIADKSRAKRRRFWRAYRAQLKALA